MRLPQIMPEPPATSWSGQLKRIRSRLKSPPTPCDRLGATYRIQKEAAARIPCGCFVVSGVRCPGCQRRDFLPFACSEEAEDPALPLGPNPSRGNSQHVFLRGRVHFLGGNL